MQLQLPHSTYVVSGIIRLCKFALFGFLVLLLLLAAGYWEEDWRGSRVWANCQRELQAKGETLDWHKFVPPTVPDESNLAMAPLFVRELHYKPDPKTGVYTFGFAAKFPASDLKDMPFAGPKPADIKPSGYEMGMRMDLAGYAQYYRRKTGFPHSAEPQTPEADVLLGLTRYAPALDQLALAAAERPLTRFPVDWYKEDVFSIRLPHNNLELQLALTLRLRASARLASGDADNALRDLELAWRLCRDMPTEPTLIAYLVDYTCVNLTLSQVWEGLADRRWASPELIRLQGDLEHFDFLVDYLRAIRSERAAEIRGIDHLKNLRDVSFLRSISDPDHPASEDAKMITRAAGKVTPPAWFDINKATIARWIQDYPIQALDLKGRRVFPDKVLEGTRFLSAMSKSPFNALPKFMLPVLDNILHKTAVLQAVLDEAVISCALERFFIDHQKYPEQLEELSPAYLSRVPTDLTSGMPLHYRQKPDGRYQLYSIGWDNHDDGGKVVWSNARQVDKKQGDWVWQYTPVQPPPPAATKK